MREWSGYVECCDFCVMCDVCNGGLQKNHEIKTLNNWFSNTDINQLVTT